VPTVIWLGVIAWFSTDTFSAEHTGRVLSRIVHFLFGELSNGAFEYIHFLLRKSAHFFSYGLLSVFSFFAWRRTLPLARAWAGRWSLLASLLTLAAGSGDEFHQSFLRSRTSSVRDVGIDFAGAIFMQLVIALVLVRRRSRASSLLDKG
jgi:VanZ family protein